MLGHKARHRGTPQATTMAGELVPSHNGHRVPRTREARTTHDFSGFVVNCLLYQLSIHHTPHCWCNLFHVVCDLTAALSFTEGALYRATPELAKMRRCALLPSIATTDFCFPCGTGQGAKDSSAPTPAQRTHGQSEAGPGRTPKRTGGRGWESACPQTQERALWGG